MATKTHSFHIPVMGIGFTIDTPLKVSHFGIDSVISLIDDMLIEKLRKMYCGKHGLAYHEITKETEDHRAKRITAYLDLLNTLAKEKFERLKTSLAEKSVELRDYLAILPDGSGIKRHLNRMIHDNASFTDIKEWIMNNLSMGSIDVNIMTKVQRANYGNSGVLPVEYNDALSALRGFANSGLNSSIIFSAGMNPALYSYMAKFNDFFPDKSGEIKKKIVLKVSDYRSALIQGKFLAGKGLWVSEYRIESGLNCGGHAFASTGNLMGPILSEFRDHREELHQTVYERFLHGLSGMKRHIPHKQLPIKISAQGGVGTAVEHRFLLDHYHLDSVGWGTPFLLVPEVTNVDDHTLEQLSNAKENDLYLSNISPLGIPFNSLRGNTKDLERDVLIAKGRPGSSCPKQYAALNMEFSEKGLCTASRHYQHLKIKELDREEISPAERQARYAEIVEKSCTCVGLGTSALLANKLNTKTEGEGVSVCPGPNMAYFSGRMSLKEIIDHIYGRGNVLSGNERPNMFIKELSLYLNYLKSKIEKTQLPVSAKQEKYLLLFAENLKSGINYYCELFSELRDEFEDVTSGIMKELDAGKEKLSTLYKDIMELSCVGKMKPLLVEAI